MEKWNTSERALSPENCPVTGLFCGIEDRTSKSNNKFKVLKLDNTEGSWWLPLFKVSGANIKPEQAMLLKNATVVVNAGKNNDYILDFKPL